MRSRVSFSICDIRPVPKNFHILEHFRFLWILDKDGSTCLFLFVCGIWDLHSQPFLLFVWIEGLTEMPSLGSNLRYSCLLFLYCLTSFHRSFSFGDKENWAWGSMTIIFKVRMGHRLSACFSPQLLIYSVT